MKYQKAHVVEIGHSSHGEEDREDLGKSECNDSDNYDLKMAFRSSVLKGIDVSDSLKQKIEASKT